MIQNVPPPSLSINKHPHRNLERFHLHKNPRALCLFSPAISPPP
ncbi:hypothetical protein 1013_scaffold1563_00010 [Bacteriophage sp.]|nr:hypothetical protein 1013_scaffold1563_00010 [Bacteriophage sp.]